MDGPLGVPILPEPGYRGLQVAVKDGLALSHESLGLHIPDCDLHGWGPWVGNGGNPDCLDTGHVDLGEQPW